LSGFECPSQLRTFKQENNDHVEVVEDRSTPAKRIKSEPPMFQSNQNDPIIIEEALFQDDSDIEFIEERNVRTK
jgi:hypothetical protein